MRISDWSSDVFSSDLPAIFDAECGNQGFAIFQRFWKHLQGVDEYDRHSRIRLRHQMKQHGAFRTAGGYRCDFAQRSFGEQLRSEEHTSELQSLMRISYAVFCLNKTRKRLTSILAVQKPYKHTQQ